jgi:hypothetical protein
VIGMGVAVTVSKYQGGGGLSHEVTDGWWSEFLVKVVDAIQGVVYSAAWLGSKRGRGGKGDGDSAELTCWRLGKLVRMAERLPFTNIVEFGQNISRATSKVPHVSDALGRAGWNPSWVGFNRLDEGIEFQKEILSNLG